MRNMKLGIKVLLTQQFRNRIMDLTIFTYKNIFFRHEIERKTSL